MIDRPGTYPLIPQAQGIANIFKEALGVHQRDGAGWGQCPDDKISPVEASRGVMVKLLLLRKSLLDTSCGVGGAVGDVGNFQF